MACVETAHGVAASGRDLEPPTSRKRDTPMLTLGVGSVIQ